MKSRTTLTRFAVYCVQIQDCSAVGPEYEKAVGVQKFLLHFTLCKLDLGQGQVSMQSDLASCNFLHPNPSRAHSHVLIVAQHPSCLCRASVHSKQHLLRVEGS